MITLSEIPVLLRFVRCMQSVMELDQKRTTLITLMLRLSSSFRHRRTYRRIEGADGGTREIAYDSVSWTPKTRQLVKVEPCP